MANRRRTAARRPNGVPERGIRLTGGHAEYWNQIVDLSLDVLQGGEERPSANPARAAEKDEDLP